MGKAPQPAPPPAPTPPTQTSAATTGTNVTTAIANAYLQNMNERTPYGDKEFREIGTKVVEDPYTGQSYEIPRFEVIQNYTPTQLEIQAQQDRASKNLATTGADLTETLGNQIVTNFELGDDEAEQRLFDLGMQRLGPTMARRDEDLRARLANQGIKVGSEAYDREMELLDQQENDALNQLLLQGRGIVNQETLTEDNQRINQISALLGGGQVSQPNFLTANAVAPIAGTDNASIIGNYDAGRLQGYNSYNTAVNNAASINSRAALGAGNLLLGFGKMAFSDERMKEDKEKIGETKDGLGIYSFRYKGSPRTEIGLMAQEVKKKKPDAVKKTPSGLMAVDYGKALS